MEKPPSCKSKPKPEPPEFFCHLCGIFCASALNLQTHFLGIKHRKEEEALRDGKGKDDIDLILEPKATLQEHVDACKNSEPAVGLEYIYQYKNHSHSIYECKLCECRSGMTHMFMHIVGAKHRMMYMSKHHPKLGIFGPYVPKGPKKLKRLRDVCLRVENEFGRQKINVVELMESHWSFSTDITGAITINYKPDKDQNQMDFTSDDYFATSNEPKASEHIVTFLELKAAHEADKGASSSSDDIACTTEESEILTPIEDTEQEIKDTVEESKKETCEEMVPNMEPCESDQEFTSNKDLLDFLEHFRILEYEDSKFVIEVVEMLLMASLKYSKENMSVSCVPTSDYPTEQKSQNQDLSPSFAPSKQDPEWHSKKPLFPISQPVKIAPLCERPKLTFTLSSSKAQEPGPSCNHDSATKFDPSTNILQEKDPQVKLVPNWLKRRYAPSAAPRKAAPPHVPSTAAPPRVPSTAAPPRVPSTAAPPRVPSTAAPPRVPSTAAPPRVQSTAAPPRVPPTAAPPRVPTAVPPLFPVANHDIMKTFFESIKNMEVSEVVTTLNKITATNPAFRGIHVPSLIRYLTETGKLKPAVSKQQQNQ
ncbi:uncharacterized protein ACNLHF_023142 [Anomaloglossus baeobatrachus]|uniref:uncharacterized protein LOC142244335 n=1 Tax=Anomaloglossus baeobatrachus TaxID=238106 RepID=UPI003F507505